MLEAYEATFPYRLALGVAFFVVLGLVDWIRHPENPRRAKEYLFLGLAVALAVAYGVAHDHVTATISRPYFLRAKGLEDDPRPYRLAVTVLAARATYWVGLVAGAALLIANNPSAARPQLAYPRLVRLALLPLGAALAGAVLGAAAFGFDLFSLERATRAFVHPVSATRFLVVWGAHAGSYAGGAVGIVVAVWLVRRARRQLVSLNRNGADSNPSR